MAFELRFTIPGEPQQSIALDQDILQVGSLLSNQIVLNAEGVEPIHAIFEKSTETTFRVIDLGSDAGIKINGKRIDVETTIKAGDSLEIGSVKMSLVDVSVPPAPPKEGKVPPPPLHPPAPLEVSAPPKPITPPVVNKTPKPEVQKSASQPSKPTKPAAKKRVLFNPKNAKPSGSTLEVVSYWGDTVVEVDHFGEETNQSQVTLGDGENSNFVSGEVSDGEKSFKLAQLSSNGFKIKLQPGMKAKLHRGGKIEEVKSGAHSLSRSEIAHIKQGTLSFFFRFVKMPNVQLPARDPIDGLLMALSGTGVVIFALFTTLVFVLSPSSKKDDQLDDVWQQVLVPEVSKPKPKTKKPKPPPKKKQEVAKVKKEPAKPKPPKPPKEPPKPAPPKVVKEVKQPKPVEKPVPKSVAKRSLQKVPKNQPKQQPVKRPRQNRAPNPSPANARVATTPKRNPGARGPRRLGRRAGNQGGASLGRGGPGGQRKGNQKTNVMGAPGRKNNKGGGINLGNLGVGVGKIINKGGPGAIGTNFRNSAGGLGGGSGSGTKTRGLGGLGSGSSLGLSGNPTGGFGRGAGLAGQGGGGLGGIGRGRGGAGRRGVNVRVSPGGAPGVSGGLTAQEVQQVIRTNLNAIRHCYEQLLQRSPSSQGGLKMRFVVGTNGRVTNVSRAGGSISDSRMVGCVSGKIRRWPFPRPRGGQPVTVTYPFRFSPL